MATPKRNSASNQPGPEPRTFFVTSATAARRRYFQVERHAELLMAVLFEYRASSKYLLHEFCIMPEHVHLLVTVGQGMTIEKAVQLIKGGFSFRAGKEFGGKGAIWERGFSEVRILDRNSFQTRREYIRANPVVANLARTPEEFAFSSAWPGRILDPMP